MLANGSAWLDDRLVPGDALRVSADDPGFTIADGVFETMRVLSGEVVALDAHLARFSAARRALAMPTPPSDVALAIAAVVAATQQAHRGSAGNSDAPLADYALRLTVTTRPTLLVRPRALTSRDHARRAGLALFTLPARRGEAFLARFKSLAWSANAVQTRLHPHGAHPAFEGLWLDPEGCVLEGTTTNLFAVFGELVVTPPTTSPILPGISRARTIAALTDLGVVCREAPITRAELEHADALFATNALLPIAPITRLDEVAVGTPATLAAAAERLIGPLSRALAMRPSCSHPI